jgi:hypothetical protein
MKDLKKKSEAESNIDFPESCWEISKSDKEVDGGVNDIASTKASCLTKESLFSSNANDLNFCRKYDDGDLDHSSRPIELFMSDYNPIRSPKNNNLFSTSEMNQWNEVFDFSSIYLRQQQEEYPACDYFKLLEEPFC